MPLLVRISRRLAFMAPMSWSAWLTAAPEFFSTPPRTKRVKTARSRSLSAARPASTRAARGTGGAGQGVLVARARHLDQEHVVVETVPDVELAGDLAVELAERVGDRGQRDRLARCLNPGQHRLGGGRTSSGRSG